jgi:hypothetical protein
MSIGGASAAQRRSAIDGRTTRHEGYTLSQKKRKRIEEIFGWLKIIGGSHTVNSRRQSLYSARRSQHRLTRAYSRSLLSNNKAPACQYCPLRIGHDDLPRSFQGGRQRLAGVHAPAIASDLEGDHGHRLSAALPAVGYRLPREMAKLGIEYDAFLLPRPDDDRRVDRIALGVSARSG